MNINVFIECMFHDNHFFCFVYVNSTLASKLPLPVNEHTYDNPHTKTHLLLQAHFSREQLPMSDYLTDTKSVLDQAIRVLQVGEEFVVP